LLQLHSEAKNSKHRFKIWIVILTALHGWQGKIVEQKCSPLYIENFFVENIIMRKLSAFILASLFLAACSKKPEPSSLYHEDGRAKPKVAIASMIDTTSYEAPWSLSEEFTSMIVNQMTQNDTMFVQSKEEAPFVENPFGPDLSWVKREFRSHEFAVFLELVEHQRVPANKEKKGLPLQEVSTHLEMGVRLRVIDLRGPMPKVVLQEMVRESYFIPKTLLPTDYSQTPWGSPGYEKTPMGIAHAQLIQEIVSRITDYILLAKSR
jgi:hypothetical protein